MVFFQDDVSLEGCTLQRLDFLCDAQFPGMKFRWKGKTGQDWYMRSWRNANNPSLGDLAY